MRTREEEDELVRRLRQAIKEKNKYLRDNAPRLAELQAEHWSLLFDKALRDLDLRDLNQVQRETLLERLDRDVDPTPYEVHRHAAAFGWAEPRSDLAPPTPVEPEPDPLLHEIEP